MERIVIELDPELKKEFEVAVILDGTNGGSKKDVLTRLIAKYISEQKQKTKRKERG